MKIDIDYIKMLLNDFEECDSAYLNSLFLRKYLTKNENKFIFHWEILQDKGLVSGANGKVVNIIQHGLNDYIFIGGINLRLTDQGHQFYEALKDEEILEKLKSNVKSFSIDSMMKVAKILFDKKLESLLDA